MSESGLYNPETLNEAVEGFKEFSARFAKIAEEAAEPRDNMVSFIQRLPADDMDKKVALARFYQSPEGQRYSSEERKQGYDNLLGPNRNGRTHG